MVKTYLSYALKNTLGQITNSKAFSISKDLKTIFVAFNDYVMGFDLKTGQEILKFKDQNIKITYLLALTNTLIIGYDNGSLYLLDLSQIKNNQNIKISKEKRTFIHQKGISCMNHNNNETRLVIGSVDKLISVIDIVSNLIVYKLSGHKEKINNVKFYDSNEQFIFSISDDFSFKIWDTYIQKCIYTYSDTANKLTSFINIDSTLLFGTFSKEIYLFYINLDSYLNSDIETIIKEKNNKNDLLLNKGTIKKQSNNKTIALYSNNEIFMALSNDSSIELYKILSKKELKARLVKYNMNIKKMNFLDAQTNMAESYKEKNYDFKLKFKSIFQFEPNSKRASSSKIFSSFLIENNKFGFITNQNSIDIYRYSSNLLEYKIFSIDTDNKKVEVLDQEKDKLSIKLVYSIGQNIGGHHSQVYLVKYSPSNQEFYSVSSEEIKLWGGKNLDKALKSQTIKNITSLAFEEDKDIVIVSTKKGHLYLLNMNSLEIIKTFEKIHSGSITEIIALPYREEKHIIVTCSNDKTIKFWNLEFNDENDEISLDFENEMNVLDSVNCALATPDLKFFSYALLDNTIKVFYFDTMKIHLNLYGHKMPVTHYDISDDGILLVSGSLDKSVKIWGMDFGDCHKTLPAHTDVVTCVKFIKNTHFFITASKDCNIKYYDGDTFDFVLLLTKDLLCNQFLWIDINSEGTQILASSNDSSIKMFEISDEQAVPKLTQQELLESNMIKEQEKEFNNMNNNALNNKNEMDDNVTHQLTKKMDHLSYAENLIEKLNLCEKFKDDVIQYHMEVDEYLKNMKIVSDNQNKIKDVKIYNLNISMEKPKPSLFFFGKNIFEIILEELKNIPYFDLENVLNNISYAYFQKLVYYFEHYIRKNIEIELIGRCIIFFCTIYEDQISNDKVILNSLRSIYQRLQGRFKLKYSLIKFNSKSIELIIKKFQDIQKNKNLMNEEMTNNIIDLKE